jgi:octaprenyl-diphosphate synthase
VEHINRVGSYVIFAGGKRLRPVLFLLAARALGGAGDARLSAIFEYLHAATLLHDDVVDEAGLRRGRPAARVEYGNDSVILVGDFLFSQAYSLAVEVADGRFVAALAECTTAMAEGQVLELMHTGDLELTTEGYLEIIRAKTAVLLAAACQMGAIHAGAGPEAVAALYDYGLELGLAFQMVDDALDYVGTAHEFGKPVGHDLAEGKITLPFLHARDTAPAETRAELLDLARRGRTQPEAVARAKELVASCGGVEATYAAARAHAILAQAALAGLGEPAPGSELELLLGLPAYVLERRH